MTSKELVLRTLEFRNTDGRVPRQLWTLPWAELHCPDMIQKLAQDFTWDFSDPEIKLAQPTIAQGDAYDVGTSSDDWGCVFTNIQKGVIGEVKSPLVQDDDWEDVDRVHIPEELLTFDIDQVNASCAARQEQFPMAPCCARPFERLQFIRGTVNLYMDLMDMPDKMKDFLEKFHDFHCRLMTKWAQTDVDALMFMDDWGSQRDLLINPTIWEAVFQPMYRDFIDIAHSHGKKIFMHSDGYTMRILPKLIDLGLDAINTQIFCMGPETLQQFRGKLTFWGEIDRQNLIPNATTEEIDQAVQSVYDNLWQDGGCIAQCEFGAGANPQNVWEIFHAWEALRP